MRAGFIGNIKLDEVRLEMFKVSGPILELVLLLLEILFNYITDFIWKVQKF